MNRRSFIAQTSAGLALMALPVRALFAADGKPVDSGFHFGAVYFRGQNNPPREDWERDHRVAAEDGHTLFRHWVSWNVVEVAPGKFEWADYERMLDLAAKNGIRVVLAEMIVDFPEWLIGAHPEARIEMASGVKRQSEMHGSSMNGGHRALCLNHAPVREAAERFLTAMAARFRGHAALLGYDIWNECTEYTAERLCFCGACQQAFRDWLRAKHGDIAAVAQRWHRPSLTAYDQIELPRAPGLFPDYLDSIHWRNEDAQLWMRWRRDVIKKTDGQALIIAHETHARTPMPVCASVMIFARRKTATSSATRITSARATRRCFRAISSAAPRAASPSGVRKPSAARSGFAANPASPNRAWMNSMTLRRSGSTRSSAWSPAPRLT